MLGPTYNYADELRTPSEMYIKKDGSFSGIMRAAAGVNYYIDAIGFGSATGLAKLNGMNQSPLGIRYFLKTGQICSNGAEMYEYIDTVPKGLPGRVGEEVRSAMGVGFQGLAPGIIEDAASALNPVPLFKSVTGSGYAKCKKVQMPVGDNQNAVESRHKVEGQTVKWIKDPVEWVNGRPHQTRWIFDSFISEDEYMATPDSEKPGKKAFREAFTNYPGETQDKRLAAGVLFAALFLGVVAWTSHKSK